MLAENIDLFVVRYFDGQNWLEQWSSEQSETLPDLVEITLVARASLTNDVMTQTVVVNLKSSASAMNTLEAIEEAQQVEAQTTAETTAGTGVSQ